MVTLTYCPCISPHTEITLEVSPDPETMSLTCHRTLYIHQVRFSFQHLCSALQYKERLLLRQSSLSKEVFLEESRIGLQHAVIVLQIKFCLRRFIGRWLWYLRTYKSVARPRWRMSAYFHIHLVSASGESLLGRTAEECLIE